MSISTEIEWAQSGSMFSPRSRADKVKLLPSGIYQYVPTLAGWFLERTHDHFEFPFKVYNAGQNVISRVSTYWETNGGNLGILMNGLRGAGKTMTAQLLANHMIEKLNLPVLIVKEPVPLQSIFDSVQQDIMVIFDEFEKTHHKAEEQQKLLSTIDGMSRSVHNRLVVFTTNNPTIDENFKDRPSRIHYQFEFQRVADEIIDGLINDSLPEELHCYKNEIFDFLHSRYICTIDIVKAVIAEVRTFKEAPTEFEHILNISKGEPPSFTIAIVNEETCNVIKTVCEFFKPDSRYVSLMSGNKRAVADFTAKGHSVELYYRGYTGTFCINLLEKCEDDNYWLAEIAVPKSKTPFDGFSHLYDGGETFYLDNRPDNWKFPFTPESVRANPEQLEKLNEVFEKSLDSMTVYGTGKKAIFKISIEPNRDAIITTKWKVTGKLAEQYDEPNFVETEAEAVRGDPNARHGS